IVIRENGRPLVSYHSSWGSELRILDCDDVACSTGTTSTLYTDGIQGVWNAMALRADGIPLIASRDDTDQQLDLVTCSDADCSNYSSVEILDDIAVGGGASNSIGHIAAATAPDGAAVFAYVDDSNDFLKFANVGDLASHIGANSEALDTACSGSTTFVALVTCPAGSVDGPACDAVGPGGLCEADAEDGCGLDASLDNCGGYDWYLKRTQ
ncbi:MAG: hypothetical protein VCC68_13515, partial [Myxococcota bacterium]